MAKVKKDESAAIEASTEKKVKKRKSNPPTDVQEIGSPEAEPAATAEVERKVVLSPIAVPLADSKLKKRAYKLVKKAALAKQLKRGVKEVVKALRKGSKGYASLQ